MTIQARYYYLDIRRLLVISNVIIADVRRFLVKEWYCNQNVVSPAHHGTMLLLISLVHGLQGQNTLMVNSMHWHALIPQPFLSNLCASKYYFIAVKQLLTNDVIVSNIALKQDPMLKGRFSSLAVNISFVVVDNDEVLVKIRT